MFISCAYCEQALCDFNSYKFHLKVFHDKKTYGDDLLCGQVGCPRNFSRFQTLMTHIQKNHCRDSFDSPDPKVDGCDDGDSQFNSADGEMGSIPDDTVESRVSPLLILRESIDENGVLSDGALFVAKLRCNPKIPLSAINDIIQNCRDLISPTICALKDEIKLLMQDKKVSEVSGDNLVEVLNVLENPFNGLESTWKQNKFFEKKGVFIPPHTFLIDSYIVPAKSEKLKSQTKYITGEFVSQELVFRQFLSPPHVLKSIITYMESGDKHFICDFRDGQFWQQHPVRLAHLNEKNTLVIPVFDFFDDLETANPLGSHSVIHKIGAKYTVMKALSPLMNSNDKQRKGVFDIYLDEMTKLESEGFSVTVDGVEYKVYVVLTQVIGDSFYTGSEKILQVQNFKSVPDHAHSGNFDDISTFSASGKPGEHFDFFRKSGRGRPFSTFFPGGFPSQPEIIPCR